MATSPRIVIKRIRSSIGPGRSVLVSSLAALSLLGGSLGCSSSPRGAASAPSGDAGPASSPAFVAHFDKSKGELPEGLWVSRGTPVVSWAPRGALVAVPGGSAPQPFASVGTAANTFTLGIVGDDSGKLYVAVGAASAVGAAPQTAEPAPAPGIYTLVPGNTAATLWSRGSDAALPMRFPNGLALDRTTLFVADSEGAIYTVDQQGHATLWSRSALLAPKQSACGGVVPLAVGANGIVVGAHNVYVTNTDYGRLVRIPIAADGTAGTAEVVAESCTKLAGADGLARDRDGSFIVAVNAQNRIARISASGAISVMLEGTPLDTPASVLIDASGDSERLLVTNSSFFSQPDAGAPGLLSVPLTP